MIVKRITKSGFRKFILPVLMTTLLMACGGGGSGGNTSIRTSADTPAVPASAFTLASDAPVARPDRSPLAPGDIAGYRIDYGTAEGNNPYHIGVNVGTARRLLLPIFPRGTYNFVMTTIDTGGRKGKYTSAIMKTV
jgi:hypothetical protein